MIFPFAILPLSWVAAKRRPTQFSSWKNMPGKRSAAGLTYGPEKTATVFEEPATTPGPEEVNDGDFVQGSVGTDSQERPVEMQELPEQE